MTHEEAVDRKDEVNKMDELIQQTLFNVKDKSS